ncbi:MAG: glycosyltransferase family 9 protein [Planctomycetota bacterium]|nr:glycosyltransferase family 9 protein [Planctomycetota bacterium]
MSRRLLIVRLSAMGDIVESLGAVRALATASPEDELVFVCQRSFVPLLENLDYLHEVVVHDRRAGLRGYLATCRAVREQRCDVALDLQGNWKSAGICWASRAPDRIGPAGAFRRERTSGILLNRRVSCSAPLHPARVALSVVRALAPDAEDLPPCLVATAAEVAAAADGVRSLGLDPDRPFRVLVVASPRDPRSWPIDAMRREAEHSPLPCLWLAGPAEEGVSMPDGVVKLRHGADHLRELVGLGALVARSGGEVLGPDQGATHVLAACGARTVALFGPQDPALTAPVGAEVLGHREPPPCAPCRQRECSLSEGAVCMDFDTSGARRWL